MLEELQAFALLGLIVTHGLLVRGCTSIREILPDEGGRIASKIDRTADLLDEVAQLISDLSDSAALPTKAQTPSSPIESLLSAFMTRTAMQNHGTTQEWEIHQTDNDPPQTEEQGIEHHQHG